MQLRSLGVVAALSLATSVVPITSATAASSPPPCPGGSVCFYSGTDFHGLAWEWTADSGYHDLPPQLHENVASFVASTDACFINWQPKETREVHNGDWRRSYKGEFGGKIDGVNPGHC
jgi:hypothetical protein